MAINWIISIAITHFSIASAGTLRDCKATPSSPLWPCHGDWEALNTTLNGNLLAPLPPAIVCDKSYTHYSRAQCDSVGEQWHQSLFHDNDPVSLHQPNWQHDACLPSAIYNKTTTCNLKPFPKYTVNASETCHVQDALRFASKHNLRVSVKNTGHDYLGRSTSPEFSIWTHHLRGIELHSAFQAKNCSSHPAFSAMTVGAGNQLAQVYSAAKEHDLVVVGGAEPSVGIGGYLTGGGHSPLGAKFGLAADNVLEMEVVVPSGDVYIANDCQNRDLFWAMTGGGGATFGVMTSVTLRTYPDYPASNFTLFFQSTDEEANVHDNTHFYDLLASMYEALIEWSDSYINGYFTWAPATYITGNTSMSAKPLAIEFTGWGHNVSLSKLNSLMGPFVKAINETGGVFGTFSSQEIQRVSDLLGGAIETSASGAGSNAILGSRLWAKETLHNKEGLIQTFRELQEVVVQGLLVSGPGVRIPALAEGTSVSPTWRTSYLHSLAASGWGYRNSSSAEMAKTIMKTKIIPALQKIAPEMGCYSNEAYPDDPHRIEAFWGKSNYARLLKLKRLYDPHGVFWCDSCVGMEDWVMNPRTQQLCRV